MLDDAGASEGDFPAAPETPYISPEELKRLERRAHQCKYCDSTAQYEVHLYIRYGRHLVASEHLVSDRKVCAAHTHKAYEFITSPTNKRIISQRLARIGRLSLDWSRAIVEFVPCGDFSWSPEHMMPIAAA